MTLHWRGPAMLVGIAALAACDDNRSAPSYDINGAATAAQTSINSYANDTGGAAVATPTPVASSVAANGEAPPAPPAPGTPGGLPDDRTPVSEAPFAPDSAQGAADVVQTYYALLGEQRYADAWRLWEPGAAGLPTTADAFVASFAPYADVAAQVGGPGAIDAGAGQRFVTVPVQVMRRRRDGGWEPWRLGRVVLHRAVVDGAAAGDRRWRIQRIELPAR